MELLTKQDVIDKVRKHFEEPGAVRAVVEEEATDDYTGEPIGPKSGDCVYRLNGEPSSPVRCAMGVCIPDELYDPEWEGTCASGVLSQDSAETLLARFAPDVQGDHFFLDNVQAAHDHAVSVESFLNNLKELAEGYGLTWAA